MSTTRPNYDQRHYSALTRRSSAGTAKLWLPSHRARERRQQRSPGASGDLMRCASGVRAPSRRDPQKRKPRVSFDTRGSPFGTLTVTYSSVATGETTIGAERFHFRVRNGIGWFPLAMAVRETFLQPVAPINGTTSHQSGTLFSRRLSRSTIDGSTPSTVTHKQTA